VEEDITPGEEAGILVGMVVGFLLILIVTCLVFYAISWRHEKKKENPVTAKAVSQRYTLLDLDPYSDTGKVA
jgi:hypothetical protein